MSVMTMATIFILALTVCGVVLALRNNTPRKQQ